MYAWQIVFAQLIKVYRNNREVRPLGKANFQKSRARQLLRVATTKLGSRYPAVFQNQVSLAPGLSSATASCSLLPPPLLTPGSFFLACLSLLAFTASWILYLWGFSGMVFKIPRQKNHRNIGKYSMWASKQIKSLNFLQYLKQLKTNI